MRLSRILPAALLVVAAAGLTLLPSAFAKGPPGGVIYAHDVTYRTVGTPQDLPNHGKFDTIYVLGEPYANVSDAAPGDQEFNGGRWEVRPIMWNIERMQFTNAEQIHAAAQANQIVIGEVIRRFECPLIRAGD